MKNKNKVILELILDILLVSALIIVTFIYSKNLYKRITEANQVLNK